MSEERQLHLVCVFVPLAPLPRVPADSCPLSCSLQTQSPDHLRQALVRRRADLLPARRIPDLDAFDAADDDDVALQPSGGPQSLRDRDAALRVRAHLGCGRRERTDGVLGREAVADLLVEEFVATSSNPSSVQRPRQSSSWEMKPLSARWLRNVDGRTTLPLSSSECSNVPTNTCLSPSLSASRLPGRVAPAAFACRMGEWTLPLSPISCHLTPPFPTRSTFASRAIQTTTRDIGPARCEQIRGCHSSTRD